MNSLSVLKNSSHPASKKLAANGFFNGIRKFSTLEGRIRKLKTTKEKGDAFEVFVEGYLCVIRKVRDIMPSDCITSHFRKKFRLPLKVKDAGVDGLFLGENGQWTAYQAKYRSNQKTVTWNELGTFFGAAESVPQRCVVTNCQEVTDRASNRRDYYTIRQADFERLTAEEFTAIEAWLKEAKPKLVKEPDKRPHQEAAIKDVCKNLKKNSRTHAVMACGTGKTIVALKIAQRMKAKRVLVLLPSLALVRQTYREWLKHYHQPDIRFVTVCSDFGINKGMDELTFKACDSEFPVTTDAKELRDRLKGADKVVVFSTYQSSKVVGKACGRKFQFDLGIFDEAHKTAGKADSLFAYPLSDKNIRIEKRFFLTATPRHVNIRKRDKEGEFEVASMDDPNVYGTLAHRLPFSEAAKKGIICDYKIVASIVTQEDVSRELLKQGEVKGKTDHVRAIQVAHQLALKNAIQKFKLTKLFTFHSSIRGAKSFVAEGDEGISAHVKKLHTCHVNGSQSSAIRESILSEFRETPRALVSNARCLTEGVDVPAVDCVAFVEPRRSKVDIVQAVGRAMRKAKGKTCGYLFVPLYVEQKRGESIDEAVERTGFGEVADVLNAMRDHDDDLKDTLEVLGVQMGEGKIKGVTARAFSEKVSVIGPSIPLPRLRKSIQTELVEQLVVSWDVRFGELKAFEKKNGHCLIPQRFPENLQLGHWASNQRGFYKKGNLTEDRIRKLEKLGFAWQPDETVWRERYEELKAFHKKEGDCRVPKAYPANPPLGIWVEVQRANYIKGKLRKDRTKKLEILGFDWNPFESQWDEKFEELKAFHKREGHCLVPAQFPENPQLAKWVPKQRSIYRGGNLSRDKIKKLDQLGFDWDPIETLWNDMYEALRAYRKKEGHCRVPKTRSHSENNKLGTWVVYQRHMLTKGSLSEDKISKLDKLGFDWNPIESEWNERFEELKAFRKREGHCLVPPRYPENPKLGGWVSKQREIRKRGTLSRDKIKKLNQLGFDWDPRESQWHKMFEELKTFHKKEGSWKFSDNDPETKSLLIWVTAQRSHHQKGMLAEDRIKKLDKLGLDWDPNESQWNEMYEALKGFQKKEGHCRAPQKDPKYKQLGVWVVSQRALHKKKVLGKDKFEKLDRLGFDWNPDETVWNEMYEALKAFRKGEGHCRVPAQFPENPQLGRWVFTQRRMRKTGKLPKDKIKKLDRIGFIWAIR